MILPFLRLVTVADRERVARNYAGNAQIIQIHSMRLRLLALRDQKRSYK